MMIVIVDRQGGIYTYSNSNNNVQSKVKLGNIEEDRGFFIYLLWIHFFYNLFSSLNFWLEKQKNSPWLFVFTPLLYLST